MDFGMDESSANQIIRKVGYIMIVSVEFELPKKIFDRQWQDVSFCIYRLIHHLP